MGFSAAVAWLRIHTYVVVIYQCAVATLCSMALASVPPLGFVLRVDPGLYQAQNVCIGR